MIAYASKHGFTKQCVEALAAQLSESPDVVDLNHSRPNLSKYDKVIVGGSIYAGGIRKPVAQFVNNNLEDLKNKKLGLFICGAAHDDDAQKEIVDSFPVALREVALVMDTFGGEFRWDKMNFFERAIIKKINAKEQFQPQILTDNIARFAEVMNKA
jgi:menaquinone-dependent protoporphyrinogen oxidase